MIFNNLILNSTVWNKLSNTFNNKKIPNAFIFSGDDGVGKEAHAIELSALLNCKRIDNNYPCGDCRSCLKIKSFKHEEVHFIHSTPPPKKKSDSLLDQKVIDELGKNYKQKSLNPYHKIKIGNSATIPISSIRSLKKKLYYSKSDENWSVVIIFDAEKLCTQKAESANSLLKILEEPPERTLFILITSNINLLIPTIQSRCQKVYFKNLTKTELQEYSLNHLNENLTNENLDIALGSIGKLINSNNNDRATNFKEIIQYFYSKDVTSIEKLLISLNNIKRKNNDELKYYFDLIKISIKDLYLLESNEKNKVISFSFLRDDYDKIIDTFPNANFKAIAELLDETILNISRNINLSLEIYALMINIRSCMQGKRVNRFYQQIGN